MNDPATEIEGVVTALLRGDTKARQRAVKQYFTEDALFVHPLLSLQGRSERLKDALKCANDALEYI